MMIIWTSLGFVHLMVSSSYLTDMKFAILMGLVTKGIMEKNHSRTNRNNTLKNTRHVKEGDIPYGTIG